MALLSVLLCRNLPLLFSPWPQSILKCGVNSGTEELSVESSILNIIQNIPIIPMGSVAVAKPQAKDWYKRSI